MPTVSRKATLNLDFLVVGGGEPVNLVVSCSASIISPITFAGLICEYAGVLYDLRPYVFLWVQD